VTAAEGITLLLDPVVFYAKSKGVKYVINPDAHRNEHSMFLRLGAGVARKGWLEKQDVINTLPLDKLRRELQAKRNSKRA